MLYTETFVLIKKEKYFLRWRKPIQVFPVHYCRRGRRKYVAIPRLRKLGKCILSETPGGFVDDKRIKYMRIRLARHFIVASPRRIVFKMIHTFIGTFIIINTRIF